jgi:hypothetical protein
MPFRRALSQEDQAVCDQMFACATQPLQAEVQLGRPWRFEAVLMAAVLEHATMVGEMVRRLEEISGSPTIPHW